MAAQGDMITDTVLRRVLLTASLTLALVAASALPGRTGEHGGAETRVFPLHAEIVNREALLSEALAPWTGDLDGMIARRMIRVLVVYDDMFYFVDRYRQRGITFELLSRFGEAVNQEKKLRHGERVEMIFIPVGRDRLIPDLVAGVGDIAAGAVTVTPEREKLVAFSDPLDSDVREVLVTGKGFPEIAAPEDLSGQEVAVRPLSSYAESLAALNRTLTAAGKPPVTIVAVDENLTDGNLAGLVAAGLYPATLLDSYETELWSKVHPDLVVHDKVALRSGGKIAWAFRKDSPQLAKVVNRFVKDHALGSLVTNILVKRYLGSTRYVKQALSPDVGARMKETLDIFKTYGERYHFDWLALVAQAYQESKLDQSVVSSVGAVGLMQLLPATAAAPPIGIRGIEAADPNVHAGAKYMRYIIDAYFDDPEIPRRDKHLLALAAYNAGPNRIAALRRKAKGMKLDPNRWFGNMEVVVARHVGRQPVEYVANILRYYVAYRRSRSLLQAEALAKEGGD